MSFVAQFLCLLITYSVNLVFRNVSRYDWSDRCKTLHFKIDGDTKCCMVYDAYEMEDGWFVAPLYQFTSDRKTAYFEIIFEEFRWCELHVAGFVFQPLEEKVELHDQGLEEYQDIVKAASQSLFYKSHEDLKKLLSTGFHINNHKTFIVLNENGERCEMLSIAECLISSEGGYNFYNTELYSRFPHSNCTREKGFKVRIGTQFLTPSIRYTESLVICNRDSNKQKYVGLIYKLEGETKTSMVYLATATQDGYSYTADLYQFASNGRTFDFEILFEDHKFDLEVAGILFMPLKQAEHGQVLEDEELSNDSMQWTMKEEDFCTNLLKCFQMDNDQEGYAVDKDGKKCLKFTARGIIRSDKVSFKWSPESRLQEVAEITNNNFDIHKNIAKMYYHLEQRMQFALSTNQLKTNPYYEFPFI